MGEGGRGKGGYSSNQIRKLVCDTFVTALLSCAWFMKSASAKSGQVIAVSHMLLLLWMYT